MKRYPRCLVFAAVPNSPKAKTSEIVMLVAKTPQRFTAWCSCHRKRRSDGTCAHLDALLGDMKPWYRQRTSINVTEPVRG